MKKLLLFIGLLLLVVTIGCSETIYVSKSLFDEKVIIKLPNTFREWTEAEIKDLYEGRELPSHVFSSDQNNIQIDFVTLDFSVVGDYMGKDLFETMYDFRVTMLNQMDEISDVKDIGIYKLNNQRVGQIRYYNLDKQAQYLMLLSSLEGNILYVRISAKEDYLEEWESYEDIFLESFVIAKP